MIVDNKDLWLYTIDNKLYVDKNLYLRSKKSEDSRSKKDLY